MDGSKFRIDQISIGKKLFIAFLSVLGLQMLTGFLALNSLKAVNAGAAGVKDNWLPSASTVGQLIDAVDRYRLWESRIFLAKNSRERDSALAGLRASTQSISLIRISYGKLENKSPAEAKLIREFDDSWKGHRALSEQLIAEIQLGPEYYERARASYFNEGPNGVFDTLDHLWQNLEFSTAQGNKVLKRASETYVQTSRLIYLAMVVTIVLTGLLAIYLARIVARPIVTLTDAMHRMADEDLSVEISDQERGDELGVMARALANFQKRLIDRRRLIEDEKTNLVALHQAQNELVESEKLASLGRLVAGVAHEINTPLGSAYVVATTLVSGHTEFEAKVQANQIRKSDLDSFVSLVGRAGGLIETTLRKASDLVRNFKQVAVDQTSDQRRRFEVGELVHQVSTTLVPLFKSKGHRIDLDAGELVEMDSYPGPLGQVLSNLVANALIHGYGDAAEGVVRVSVQKRGESEVLIHVMDKGKGIRPEHIDHVFEPFFTTRLGQGGSGLGLNIVHRIVTSVLGGTVEVHSEVGVGTMFILVLPVRAPEVVNISGDSTRSV